MCEFCVIFFQITKTHILFAQVNKLYIYIHIYIYLNETENNNLEEL